MTGATMRAAVLRAIPSDHLQVTEVPAPLLERDDDVILRVDACGICGTDLHILEGVSYRPELPFVLGHEPVGTVVQAGPAAQRWLGKRVTITLFTGCGTCPACRAGDERLCPDVVSDTGVFGEWGGYAELLRVHEAQLIEVPDSLGASQAAALVDSGATAANAVRVTLERGARRVLIVGAGPIGFLAAEMLALEGVELEVVQRSESRRAAVAARGHRVIADVDEASGPFDVVIDCTGSAAPYRAGIAALGPHGVYLLAGYAVVPEVDFAQVARKEAVIIGLRSGRREDLETLIHLVAEGKVHLPDLREWPLSQINDAIDALRERKVAGKAIIVRDVT